MVVETARFYFSFVTLERHFGLAGACAGPAETGWSAGHAFVTWLNVVDSLRYSYRLFQMRGCAALEAPRVELRQPPRARVAFCPRSCVPVLLCLLCI